MFKKLLLVAALLAPLPATAQQAVQQSGTVTRNHLPYWLTSGVIGDSGTSADSPISSIGVTNEGGAGFCVSSQRSTGTGRNQLCFGASTTGPAFISLQNYGTAAAQNLNFIINGIPVTLPTGGGSFVTGMGTFNVNDVACFASTGAVIQDCGLSIAAGTVTSGTWGGTPISLTFGGTGATSAAGARTALGLGSLALQNAGAVALTGGTATGFPTPTNPTDVAIKSYVDATAQGLHVLAPSRLVTAAVLPNSPTYANGTSGVGATLTAGSNSTLTVDGVVANVNDVVLVNNQASAFQNGIYTVTTAGSGSAAWVLTRATYFDQPAEMLAGSYTFVTAGSTQAGTAWVLQITTATVGTTAVNFSLFSQTSAGGVTSIAGNSGVFTLNASSGITNSTNDIQCETATSAQAGCVKVDNTTIQATAGVLSSKNQPVLLNTLTASNSATLSDVSSLTATYNFYEVAWENLIPTTTNVTLCLSVHSGGSYQNTGYASNSFWTSSSATVVSNTSTNCIPLSFNVSVVFGSSGSSGRIRVYAPSGISIAKHWVGEDLYVSSTGVTSGIVAGLWDSHNAVDGFQLSFSSGNIASGTLKVYGYP